MDFAQLAFNYAGRYWDLGNGITAFVVVQMLGFLYGLGEKEEFLAKVREGRWLAITLTAVSGILYSLLVMVCYYAEGKILQSHPYLCGFASISTWALACRLAIIWAMTGLGLIVLVLDMKHQVRNSSY